MINLKIMKKLILIGLILNLGFTNSDTPIGDSELNEKLLLGKYITCTQDSFLDNESIGKLIPLDSLRSKIIVAIGQSTHGSHESFLMQIELFKSCVANNDARIFCLESNYLQTLNINSYVHGGTIRRDSVIQSLGFWTWQTAEMLDFIEWMRYENSLRENSRKLSFVGMDIQDLQGTIGYFYNYLPGDLKSNADFKRTISPLLDSANYEQGFLKKSIVPLAYQIVDTLSAILDEFNKQSEGRYDGETSLLLNSPDILRKMISFDNCIDDKKFVDRDSLMAQNAIWVHETFASGKQVFLFAHNAHIARSHYLFMKRYNYKSVGTWLTEHYNGQYIAIATDFVKGTFNAKTVRSRTPLLNLLFHIELKYSPPKSCEIRKVPQHTLHTHIDSVNCNWVGLNLAMMENDSAITHSSNFMREMSIHSVGAVFFGESTFGSYEVIRSLRQYDIILFSRNSTATSLLDSAPDH